MAHHDNFTKRINRLRDEMDACAPGLLRSFHRGAIELTEYAACVYVELVNAFENESSYYSKWITSCHVRLKYDIAAITLDMERLEARFRSNPDPPTLGQLQDEKAWLLLRASALQARIFTLVTHENLREARTPTAKELEAALFQHILGPDRGAFSLEAAKSALSFGIGLVPIVGPATDAAIKIRDLANRHASRAKSADAHLQYLEEYVFSLKAWIAAAERMIQRLTPSSSA